MKKKVRILIFLLLASTFFGIISPDNAWASNNSSVINFANEVDGSSTNSGSWVNDDTIYGDNSSINFGELQTDADPGFIERCFASLIISLGDGISSLLGEDLSVTRIIYGRVKTGNGSAKINHFSFELAKGNVYGLVGAIGYNVLRSLLFSVLAIIMMYYFVKASYSNTGKMRETLKSNLGYLILGMGLLILAPQFTDLLIYFRDLILYYVGNSFSSASSSLLSAAGLDTSSDIVGNFVKQYREVASGCKTFSNAAMYLSVTIISLFFAFSYVTLAVSTMIVFMFFPVFVMLSFQDRKLLSQWLKYIMSSVCTPVVDCILMYVPLISMAVGAPTIVQFFICLSILPARGVVRNLLGLGHGMGSEMLGVGAMMAAGRLMSSGAKGVSRNIRGLSSGVSGYRNDKKMGKMHGELGKIEENEKDGGLTSGGNSSELQDLKTTQKSSTPRYDSTLTQSEYGKDATSFEGAERNSVYSKFANYKNFDSPEIYNHLSSQQKSELYRKRARKTLAKSTGQFVGGLGVGVAGGALGASGSMFLGTTGLAMATGAGFTLGNSVGSAVGEQVGSGAVSIAGGYKSAISSIASSKIHTNVAEQINNSIGEPGAEFASTYFNLNPTSSTIDDMRETLDNYTVTPQQALETPLGKVKTKAVASINDYKKDMRVVRSSKLSADKIKQIRSSNYSIKDFDSMRSQNRSNTPQPIAGTTTRVQLNRTGTNSAQHGSQISSNSPQPIAGTTRVQLNRTGTNSQRQGTKVPEPQNSSTPGQNTLVINDNVSTTQTPSFSSAYEEQKKLQNTQISAKAILNANHDKIREVIQSSLSKDNKAVQTAMARMSNSDKYKGSNNQRLYQDAVISVAFKDLNKQIPQLNNCNISAQQIKNGLRSELHKMNTVQ